jgi:hypothetical protein
MLTHRAAGRGRRRRGAGAVQEALFEVEIRPERRFYRQMLDALSRSGFGADALDAECIASRLFGTVWAGQEGDRDGSTEEAFGLGLVDYARRRRLPTSVAVMRTVARIAPIREVREAATSAAAALRDDGLPEPGWTPPLEALIPGRCWAYEDVFGDESTVICEFGYGADPRSAERHAILVYVDHAIFSVATDAMLVHDVDPLIRDMRNETRATASMFTLRQVDPAWARALLERAFARTDLIAGVRTEPTFADLRALALARLTALPDDPGILPPEPLAPSPEHREAVVAEFLAGLPDLPVEAAAVARSIVDHASTYDPGRLLRVSPAKWETFVFDFLPQHPLSASQLDVVGDVMRAWTRWAGRTLPERARAELAAALDEILADRSGTVAR